MGLFKKVFRDTGLSASARRGGNSEFAESETPPARVSWRSLVRSRREKIHVVLSETMRQHAIPADWIESRLLVDTEDPRLTTFCILLLVRDGHDSLRGYAPTFQASFTEALRRIDPQSREWLATVCWNFDIRPPAAASAAAEAAAAAPAASGLKPASAPPQAAVPAPGGGELEEDLQALFAIRDAALRTPPRGD